MFTRISLYLPTSTVDDMDRIVALKRDKDRKASRSQYAAKAISSANKRNKGK